MREPGQVGDVSATAGTEQEVYMLALETLRASPSTHTVGEVLQAMERDSGIWCWMARQKVGNKAYCAAIARALIAHQECDP